MDVLAISIELVILVVLVIFGRFDRFGNFNRFGLEFLKFFFPINNFLMFDFWVFKNRIFQGWFFSDHQNSSEFN